MIRQNQLFFFLSLIIRTMSSVSTTTNRSTMTIGTRMDVPPIVVARSGVGVGVGVGTAVGVGVGTAVGVGVGVGVGTVVGVGVGVGVGTAVGVGGGVGV